MTVQAGLCRIWLELHIVVFLMRRLISYCRQAWDLALDLCLKQLPKLLENENATFQHSPFFTEQLTAFDVWLKYGDESRSPPEQLPIVLQVLLSQVHRLRALELLGRFLDLGPWAVSLVSIHCVVGLSILKMLLSLCV